jgi:hypothetical protein
VHSGTTGNQQLNHTADKLLPHLEVGKVYDQNQYRRHSKDGIVEPTMLVGL